MVRIPGFHPGDPGSIPGRGTVKIFSGYEAMAQLAARRIPDPKVGGSTPSSFIRRIYIFFFFHRCMYASSMQTLPTIRDFFYTHRIIIGELGLVGYDDCLTRSRSRVRFSELV